MGNRLFYIFMVLFAFLFVTLPILATAQLKPAHKGRDCIRPYNYNRKNGDYTQYRDSGNFCVPCPPRSISVPGNPFVCERCPADSFVYENRCITCGSGMYIKDNSLCAHCRLTSFSNKRNAKKCTACPLHTVTFRYGGTSADACKGCGKGAEIYMRDFGRKEFGARCVRCSSNSVNSKGDLTDCEKYPIGTQAKDDLTCEPCIAGLIAGDVSGFPCK